MCFYAISFLFLDFFFNLSKAWNERDCKALRDCKAVRDCEGRDCNRKDCKDWKDFKDCKDVSNKRELVSLNCNICHLELFSAFYVSSWLWASFSSKIWFYKLRHFFFFLSCSEIFFCLRVLGLFIWRDGISSTCYKQSNWITAWIFFLFCFVRERGARGVLLLSWLLPISLWDKESTFLIF
jgi:hypothetical protein